MKLMIKRVSNTKKTGLDVVAWQKAVYHRYLSFNFSQDVLIRIFKCDHFCVVRSTTYDIVGIFKND